MDEADHAAVQADFLLEQAIRAARGIPGAQRTVTRCVTCGADIEPERIRLLPGTTQCRVCAHRVESLRSRGLL